MKISINMLSIAEKVKGQGVETAYNELMDLLSKYGKKELNIVKNGGLNCDILQMHTVNPVSYIKQRFTKGTTLTYVHFLPSGLEGAIKLPKIFIKIYAWWVKRCYLKSDYLVVVNPTYIDEMVKLGFNKNNIFYIPNYVSKDNFYVIKNKDKLRSEYGYSKDDFIVMSTGQLHKGKGVFDFIRIAEENPDIKFLWVGGFNFGKCMDGYRKIKKYYDGYLPNLKFTGVVDRSEVNKLCNISDVFFFPSFYESFGLVILEAARCEKPIILRDIDTYKELYLDKVLYGKNNDEFISYIKKLKNKKYYDERVTKTKEINVLYDEKEIYNKWISLYRKIKK